MKSISNKTKGNNSKCKKARVVILVQDMSSCPVLHFYQVSSKYSQGYSSYRVNKKFYTDTDADINGICPKNNTSPHPSVCVCVCVCGGGWGGDIICHLLNLFSEYYRLNIWNTCLLYIFLSNEDELDKHWRWIKLAKINPNDIYFIFPRKQGLTYFMYHFLRRQFAWKFKLQLFEKTARYFKTFSNDNFIKGAKSITGCYRML